MLNTFDSYSVTVSQNVSHIVALYCGTYCIVTCLAIHSPVVHADHFDMNFIEVGPV